MSRIAKKPINLPTGVEVKAADNFVWVKGPKGELKKPLDSRIKVVLDSGKIFVKLVKEDKALSALWGLYWSLISNMVKGVTAGFEKTLIFQGVGFRASVSSNNLDLSLGFSHPVKVTAPAGISFKVEKSKIIISGIDKELVGQVAAKIRELKKPEPYKGSGIRYEKEVIVKKAGKKAAATVG